MTARLASFLVAAALALPASSVLAQDWHDGPPPPEAPGPEFRDGPAPIPGTPREMRRFELRRDGGREYREGRRDGPPPLPGMVPPGPGMVMPPPGARGPMMAYAYPSPYPGWVYPPVAWVKVPIVREHRDCGCEEVTEERVVTHVAHRAHRPVRRHHAEKWVRSTK